MTSEKNETPEATKTPRERRVPVFTTLSPATHAALEDASFDLAKELRVRSAGDLARVAIGEFLVNRGIITADAAKNL